MEGTAQRLADLSLTVVGDADGALVAALRKAGARPATAGLHELARHGGAHLVFVGKAAIDGGKHALANAPAGASGTVVLPRGAAAERIAALSVGLRVVEPAEPAQLARQILDGIDAAPSPELGWTELGSLLDAFAARVALRLGADRSRGLQLRLGDASEVAALIERHAAGLVALCDETRAPDSLGPSVAVAELSWDDDPQTQRLEDEEVARWRRLSAREASPKMIRGLAKSRKDDSGKWARPDDVETSELEAKDALTSDIVATKGPAVRLPAPGRLPSGVIPGAEAVDDDPPTMPATFPLPLVQRVDHDIDETAPRPAITDHAPISDDDLELGTDTLIRDAEPLPDLPPPPGAVDEPPLAPPVEITERATVPERPPLPTPPPPREATPPPVAPEGSVTASSRPSKLPLVFGLGVIALGAVAAIVGVGLFAFGGPESVGAMATVTPAAPSSEAPAGEEGARAPSLEAARVAPPPVEGAAPVAEVVVEAADGVDADEPEPAAPEVAGEPSAPEATDEETLRARSDALVAEGQRAEREGDWAAARAAYQGAIDIYDGNPHAHAGLARERLQMEDAEGALVHAQRAAALRRRRAEYQVLIGRAQRLAGNAAAARAAFDHALELDPEDREALRALSQ